MSDRDFVPIKFVCDSTQTRNEVQWKDNMSNWIETLNVPSNCLPLLGCEVYVESCGLPTVQHLFSIAKKLINLLKNDVLAKRDVIRSSKKYNWNFVREQVTCLLWCIHRMMEHKFGTGQSNEITQLCIEVKQLLVFTGRLRDLPESVYYELGSILSNDSSACHLFHLNVELWFNCLSLYESNRLQIQASEAAQLLKDGQLAGDLTAQTANIILADQIVLAATKFKNEFAGQTVKFINPFACDCIKILLCRTRQALELNSSFSSESGCGNEIHPFWQSFNRILDQVVGVTKSNECQESIRHFRLTGQSIDMSVEDQNLCRLWITANFCNFFTYNEDYVKNCPEQDEPSLLMNSQVFTQPLFMSNTSITLQHNLPYTVKILQAIVKHEDAKTEPNLNHITIAMRLCYTFIQNWPPSIDLCLPFLDFFVKRLAVPLGTVNVESIQMLPKNGQIWAQQIRQKSNLLAQSDYGTDSPLPLFFAFLNELVTRVQKSGAQMQFQKLKGRLYSKLQPKKLEELKEIGLYNLMSLFLTLVQSVAGGWTDLIDKFGDLVRHSKSRLMHQARISLMIKATFAFLHLIPTDSDSTKLTNLLVMQFNDLADLLPNWVPDNVSLSTAHNVCASLIAQYCDELLVILDSPDHKNRLSKHVTAAYLVRFESVVHKLNDREIGNMLQFVLTTLKHLHAIVDVDFDDYSESCSSLYKHLYSNFISFVKSEFNTRTGSNPTADVAFHLTHLSLMLSSNETDFRSCVNHFAFNKGAVTSNVCRFLFFLLDNESTCQQLTELHPSGLEQCLLEHWTRIVICTPPPNHQLNKLTLELSKHVRWLHAVEADAVDAFETLCERVRRDFDDLSSFEKPKALSERNRMLMEMLNEAKNRLRDEKVTEEAILHMYAICALLIQRCATLLYASGNAATVVPVLLETLFNPTFLQNLPTIRQQQVQTALRKHLPPFLNGIEQLLCTRDPYLERKIRQMLMHFVPLLASKNARHPIVSAIVNNDGQVNSELLRLLGSYLVDNFLTKSTNPSVSFQLMQFINEIHQAHRSKSIVQQWLFEFVPQLLSKMLVCEEIVKRRIRELLQIIIGEQTQTVDETELTQQVSTHFENFIKNNRQMLNRVIKVIDLTISLYPKAKDRVITLLLNQIKEAERAKFGSDDTLRALFQQFVTNHSK